VHIPVPSVELCPYNLDVLLMTLIEKFKKTNISQDENLPLIFLRKICFK